MPLCSFSSAFSSVSFIDTSVCCTALLLLLHSFDCIHVNYGKLIGLSKVNTLLELGNRQYEWLFVLCRLLMLDTRDKHITGQSRVALPPLWENHLTDYRKIKRKSFHDNSESDCRHGWTHFAVSL